MRLTKATIITGRQVQDQALSQFIMQETERQWIDSNDSVGLARGSSAAQQTSIFTTCSCSATCRATKQSFCTSGQVHSTKITLLSKRSVSVPNGGSWWASIYVAAEETMNIWPLLKQASRHKMYIGAPFDALEWRWIMFQQLEDISIQSRGWCLEYCFCITWFFDDRLTGIRVLSTYRLKATHTASSCEWVQVCDAFDCKQYEQVSASLTLQ